MFSAQPIGRPTSFVELQEFTRPRLKSRLGRIQGPGQGRALDLTKFGGSMPFRPSTAIGPMDTWTRRTYPRSNNEARTRVQEKCSGCPTSDRRRNVLNARLADAWLMRVLAWSCASAIAT